MKNLKMVFAMTSLGAILTFGVVAFAGEYATCPKDGEQAEPIDEQQIPSNNCPQNQNSAYNAERETYSHNHISGPLLERRTFSTTTCFR